MRLVPQAFADNSVTPPTRIPYDAGEAYPDSDFEAFGRPFEPDATRSFSLGRRRNAMIP